VSGCCLTPTQQFSATWNLDYSVNAIDCIMFSVLALSAVDRWFEPVRSNQRI